MFDCLWIPKTNKLPAKKIGLPDEPLSVLDKWLNSLVYLINDLKNSDLKLYAKTIVLGDANLDGVVNNTDADYIVLYYKNNRALTSEGILNADVNLDGVVDGKDKRLILAYTSNEDIELPYTKNDVYNVEYIVDDEKYSISGAFAGESAEKLLGNKEGYYLASWYMNNQYITEYDFNMTVNSNLKLYGTYVMLGDVNQDKNVTSADITKLKDIIIKNTTPLQKVKLSSDVNFDKVLNGKDVYIISKYLENNETELPYTENNIYNIEFFVNNKLYDVDGVLKGEKVNKIIPEVKNITFVAWYTDNKFTEEYDWYC